MAKTSPNPLLVPQREKAGPQTSRKYRYQYYWAICKILQRHHNNEDYAVFVELHEDVVIANSLDQSKAQYEFNQVKTTAGRFTTKSLTKLKNGSSVLGKLLSSCEGKSYASSISSINLVAANGYSIALKQDKALDIRAFPVEQLTPAEYKKIEDELTKEITLPNGLPKNLYFITSDLLESDFREKTTQRISDLVEALYPSSHYSLSEISRSLIDEIGIKGEVTEDFLTWEDLLEKKALVSTTVSQVINNFTTPRGGNRVDNDFDDICSEFGYTKYKVKSRIRQGFDRYRQERFFNRTSQQISFTKRFHDIIVEKDKQFDDEAVEVISHVIKDLPTDIKSHFTSDDDLLGAVIFEYIMFSQHG